MAFNNFNTLSIIEHHLSFIDINEDFFTCLFTRRFNIRSNRLEIHLKSLN